MRPVFLAALLALAPLGCRTGAVRTAPTPKRTDSGSRADSVITAARDSAIRAQDTLLTVRGGAGARPDTLHPEARAAEAQAAASHAASHAGVVHRFLDLPDGGRIELERAMYDPAGIAAVRAHVDSMAAAFRRGDFTLPARAHGRAAAAVPGAATMAAKRAVITYTTDRLPLGGALEIRTADSAAVRAIHAFLRFQRAEH
ncbi:MAG TPA: hypothetical protein VFS40_13790 [Gemmatimonadales bacterium]|nr:hypothetical protein [Gemmatimonadales bacterium]